MNIPAPLVRIGMTAPKATFRYEGEVIEDTSARLAEFLEANAGSRVLLVINSPGGNAMQGAADAAEVERHGMVTALAQGICASAATLPFVAAKHRVMHTAALFMVHDPAVLALGTADDLAKASSDLDFIAETYAEVYAGRTGHPPERVRAWMKAETWMDAQDAVALGFADAIEDRGPRADPAEFDYTAYARAPDALIRMAVAKGWNGSQPQKGNGNA